MRGITLQVHVWSSHQSLSPGRVSLIVFFEIGGTFREQWIAAETAVVRVRSFAAGLCSWKLAQSDGKLHGFIRKLEG